MDEEDPPEVLEQLRILRVAYEAKDGRTIWVRALPAWSGTNDWNKHFSADEWLEMFSSLAEPPYKPLPLNSITLFRGTIAGRQRGLAWTTCFDLARWFSSRWIHEIEPGTAVGYVYKTEASASAVVCVTDLQQHPGRREHEVVVNPDALGEIKTADVISQDEYPPNRLEIGCRCESHPPIRDRPLRQQL